MKFIDLLKNRLDTTDSHVCVGLDSRYDRLPESIKAGKSVSDAIFEFNRHVIEATHEVAISYKSNIAFYAGFGAEGLEGLRKTNVYLKEHHAAIPLLGEGKRSEMGESVRMIKQEIFDWLQFDCVMVTPWFGIDTVKDYLDEERCGVIVYVHDSNPSAAEFQDLPLANGQALYEYITERIVQHWNHNGNVIVESGATYPKQLKIVREICGPDMPILTAGVGVQGGTLDALQGVFGANGRRLLVNSSRGIIFAGEGQPDYFTAVHDAARELQQALWGMSRK